jgi:hypothetical protein
MSDFRETSPDDDREVPIDDEVELELPAATLDPMESVQDDVDDLTAEERASAIEAGEIEP